MCVIRSLLIAAISSRALIAQSHPPSATGQPIRRASVFCVGSGRIGQCRSFAIVEIPVGIRLARSQHAESGGFGDAYAGLELGGMVNRDDSHAIGASVTGTVSGGESYLAINGRSRTWFSTNSHRDLSAGVVGMWSNGNSTAYGLTASASSAYAGLIGVWARADVGLIGAPPRVSVHAGVHIGRMQRSA
jgi:hypothetical protein